MKTSGNRIAVLLALGVALTYWSLTPGSFSSMGHTAEEITSTKRILNGLAGDVFVVEQVDWSWPPHGLLGLIVHVPFLVAARLFSSSPVAEELILAMQPVILSSLIVLVVFLWSVRLSGDRFRSVGYALVAAFCTMMWPYAYFGMELQQSLFLLVAAFMALAVPHRREWTWWILFGLCCGMAVSVKQTSIFLIPAVAFLLLKNHRRYTGPGRMARLGVLIAIIVVMFVANAWTRTLHGAPSEGVRSFLREYLVPDPVAWAINVVALLGSPGKGLIVYVPVALVATIVFRRVWESQPNLVIFTILALGGLVMALALVEVWTDETWGPRHLHAIVPPLVLMLAASSRPGELRHPLDRAPLLVAALLGFCVSFLGAFFDYGALHRAAQASGQSTLQAIQMDPTWNHVKFNARLLRVWITSGDGAQAFWKPEPHWYYERPEWAAEIRTVRLDDYSTPQALLIRKWGDMREPGWFSVFVSLIAGPALIFVCIAAARADRLVVSGQPGERNSSRT